MQLELDQFRELFKDEAAFESFAKAFTDSLQHDLCPIFVHSELVGTTLSPAGTKNVLFDRMMHRALKNPDLLNELTDRIENDDIVD